MLKEHSVGEDLVRVCEEDLEEVVLGRRQVNVAPGDAYLAALHVEYQIAATDTPLRPRARTRDMSQRDADARQKLVDPERFRHVVVGAKVQGVDLVVLTPSRG